MTYTHHAIKRMQQYRIPPMVNELIDDEAVAVEPSYVGECNVTTWRDHLRVLKELKFIDFSIDSTPCQWIVILNPHHTVIKLKDRIKPATYTAICQQALEIGAEKDMDL